MGVVLEVLQKLSLAVAVVVFMLEMVELELCQCMRGVMQHEYGFSEMFERCR